jgi:hypothetical protein
MGRIVDQSRRSVNRVKLPSWISRRGAHSCDHRVVRRRFATQKRAVYVTHDDRHRTLTAPASALAPTSAAATVTEAGPAEKLRSAGNPVMFRLLRHSTAYHLANAPPHEGNAMKRLFALPLMFGIVVGCSSGPASMGDGGNSSCKKPADLCAALSAQEVLTIVGGAGPLTSMPQETLGAEVMCNYKRAKPYVNITTTYTCQKDVVSTFEELKRIGEGPMQQPLTGLGDEAFWSYTSTSAYSFVIGNLYVRRGSAIIAVSQYSQYDVDMSGADVAIDPNVAKMRMTAIMQKLLQAVP